jgi:hypothetical protein
MAGTNLETLMAPQGQQPQQMLNFTQPQPSITPEILAQLMAPYAMPSSGAGVSQFLTGQMGIPMQFGVDLPAYETPQYTPGDFQAFVGAQKAGKNMVGIPVFDPNTGGYSTVQVPKPKS